MKTETAGRMAYTPRLDKWIRRLNGRLEVAGARAELLSFIDRRYPRGIPYWGTRLTEIIHRTRLPNAEVLLVIDEWLGKK